MIVYMCISEYHYLWTRKTNTCKRVCRANTIKGVYTLSGDRGGDLEKMLNLKQNEFIYYNFLKLHEFPVIMGGDLKENVDCQTLRLGLLYFLKLPKLSGDRGWGDTCRFSNETIGSL